MKIFSKLKKKKGFTLIEVLCSIAILGMIAAMAIPQFFICERERQKSSNCFKYKNNSEYDNWVLQRYMIKKTGTLNEIAEIHTTIHRIL